MRQIQNAYDYIRRLLVVYSEWIISFFLRHRIFVGIQKEEKIREAQVTLMRGQLTHLSLALEALQALPGKEQSKDYRKYLRQIQNLHSALEMNPVFTRKDLLQTKEPFLYNAETGGIFRKTDMLITRQGIYMVESLNFKQQELSCRKIMTDEERQMWLSRSRQFNIFFHDKETLKIADLSALLYHGEKPTEAEQITLQKAVTKQFYTLPEQNKERLYQAHLFYMQAHTVDRPVIFSILDQGKLSIELAYGASRYDFMVNPFSEEGRSSIALALEKGIIYSTCDRDAMLESLRQTLPQLEAPIHSAIEKAERQQAENEQNETGI